MEELIHSVNRSLAGDRELPFSVYSSVYEQNLLNVPVAKPLLIVVLSGEKEVGDSPKVVCESGRFIFLSDTHSVHIRNIPGHKPYYALLIPFDYEDFEGIPIATDRDKIDYFVGTTTAPLTRCLEQFVSSVQWAPDAVLTLRKKEILLLLDQLGYSDVASMKGKPKVSHRIHDILYNNSCHDVTVEDICAKLAMSESTLRRKLHSESTGFTEIKDRARLGKGLHLLQTTEYPINLIAEQCGYHSQSRFTQRFKAHFGLTPTELRKTRQIIEKSA